MADTNIFDMLDTWNNVGTTFTAIQMNVTDTASAAGSKLLDLQLGGASVLTVKAKAGTAALPTLTFADVGVGWYRNTANQWTFATASANLISILASNFRMSSGVNVGWGSGDSTTAADTALIRDGAAGRLALRSGTTAQGFRVYNTFTSSTNYERLSMFWSGNVATISNEAQTGTLRPLNVKFTPQTVATLPVAATVGAGSRMFVSDALTPTFGSAVTGGGAVNVPVYSDGTNWMVG